MRYDSPLVIKVREPMIGQATTQRRIRVAHQAYSLDEALAWIRTRKQGGQMQVWIEARGYPARRRG